MKTLSIRLLHVATVPQSLEFLSGQIGYMKAHGFEVGAVASPGDTLEEFGRRQGISVCAVEMPRRIAPLHDLRAVRTLSRHLRQVRPDIVHAHTPKGGLLGMIAAWLARVPVRVYHIHGLPFMTAKGYKRGLLRWSEKVACLLAHQVLCVSKSIRDVALQEGLCAAAKIKVPLDGSINGVDAQGRFSPESVDPKAQRSIRKAFAIPHNAITVGFVGRIVRDKGVEELVAAWQLLRNEMPHLHLVVAGPFETQDPISPEAYRVLREDARIHLVGWVDQTESIYAITDVLVLPSYREGFGVVLIEAAAMEVPVVATRIPGCIDAVQDGVTGTLVPPGDAEALAAAIRTYVVNPELRQQHGRAGRRRALREFHQESLWEATYQEYLRLLCRQGLIPKPTTDTILETPD